MEQKHYHNLDEVFALYEQDHPRPQSVTPAIPQGQQLGTIDKLAQAVIPKLVDKLNAANWEIEKLRAICDYQHLCINDLYKFINETALPHMQAVDDNVARLIEIAEKSKKKSVPRKKKPAEPEIDISEIADYDPDTGEWGPMVVDGHKITGSLIDVIQHLSGAADQMYSDELISFINNLDDNVKAAIAKRFPN